MIALVQGWPDQKPRFDDYPHRVVTLRLHCKIFFGAYYNPYLLLIATNENMLAPGVKYLPFSTDIYHIALRNQYVLLLV
jgi:hypothetical protein